ncbi:hypothetical protein J7F03_30550 [Streptomyces sp. ISL-43]|uniref:hypothetical protein n=1 Tax=Streptomyces sp. ISL-43 TaxID=2819183 RepID=UPI001BEAD5FF|nr:hypothetical protein [Streptomyces sp. ISL-43]MBT2451335.1 hypothetical protein [Streptomyces sp. ISL-43]
MGQDGGQVASRQAERDRNRLVKEAGAVLGAVLGHATLMRLPSPVGPEAVSVTAFDESETRSAAELTAALVEVLGTAGWTIQDTESTAPAAPGGPALYAVLPGLGSGSFAVQPPAISFAGLLEVDALSGTQDEGGREAGPAAVLSAEIRAAIKAAAPRAVYPDDEFEADSARIAGWDPQETQSNAALLRASTEYLADRGWRVSPEATDSDDRSARISKEGVGKGRLYASSRGLTFTGSVTPLR